MNLHFTHPWYLLALPVALVWVLWLFVKSDVQIGAWRRWTALLLRTAILILAALALAGLQWREPREGMNIIYLLDRSESIPAAQQEAARKFVNDSSHAKKQGDAAGVLVFGADAALESTPNAELEVRKINAVVGPDRTDIGAAIRLGTAALPENGQKRLVLLSDGNENLGDALAAVLNAQPLGVTIDVVPLGVVRANDVAVQKLSVPARLKKGQAFNARIHINADRAQKAAVRLFRNEQFLGDFPVDLTPGKNAFTFPQKLEESGFYSYRVEVEAPGDPVPQNNRASSYTTVRGEPRVLVVSSEPDKDRPLTQALQAAKLDARLVSVGQFPSTLPEMVGYDTIYLCNVAAGDLGGTLMSLLESAVRDFGVGLVCIGGDQAFLAGAYKGTPLETTLPIKMEIDSKKVVPPGAVALVMHGMEFMNGNQIARDCAQGVLAALTAQDEMGVVLWDGVERWLFPVQKVGDKKTLAREIAGMNQGDLPSFEGVMTKAYNGLKQSKAGLKHIIVFSDGDPAPPTPQLMNDIVNARITVSTVLIAGHAGPQTMESIADQGKGRFFDVRNPDDLPQIFIKETMVILKSAIFEEPFKPKLVAPSEITRGIGADEYPQLLGYVVSQPKPRAEVPLVTDKGDPLLAHWQYGLGRSVAFTSDARSKWARNWLDWTKYQQFWSQVAQWSLRRLENADFNSDVTIDRGEGVITVEALDPEGNYRNFLNLIASITGPKGQRQDVRLEQTGPGRYEARFPTRETGAYMLNVKDVRDGQVRAQQMVGTSVSYSPEFEAAEPNAALLRRVAELSGGRLLDPSRATDNPFLHDRIKTSQPHDLWEWLLKLAIVLFVLDVAVRRIQIDRDEFLKATASLRRLVMFWKPPPRPVEADESLNALLSRRDEVRARQTAAGQPPVAPNPDLFRPQQPVEPINLGTREKAVPVGNPAEEKAAEPAKDAPESTTSRLLEAKRKAKR